MSYNKGLFKGIDQIQSNLHINFLLTWLLSVLKNYKSTITYDKSSIGNHLPILSLHPQAVVLFLVW